MEMLEYRSNRKHFYLHNNNQINLNNVFRSILLISSANHRHTSVNMDLLIYTIVALHHMAVCLVYLFVCLTMD
jgi:hypothetical protein